MGSIVLLLTGLVVAVVAVVATAAAVWNIHHQAAPQRWAPTTLRTEADSLLRDPQHAHRFFAGTPDSIWVSDDDGATWTKDPGTPHGVGLLALAADAATSTIFGGGTDGAVYRLDLRAGDRWQRISPSFGTSPVFSLALAPGGQVVLAGTTGGMMRGERDGDRWEWQRVAHTGDSSVTAITWVPSGKDEVFASVFGTSPPVLRSVDGGRTWRADARGLPSALPSQALLSVPHVILSTMGDGVWQRGQDGQWREISNGLPERHAMPLLADPRTPTTLYGGTMGFGVYQRDGTADWHRLGRELNGGDYTVLALAITEGRHPLLLAGTGRGVFRYPVQG